MSDTPDPDLLRPLHAAMRALPKLQRQIFMAHRLDGLSYDDIAWRTGLTVHEVERHMAKAIHKLDKQLGGRKPSWWERWL